MNKLVQTQTKNTAHTLLWLLCSALDIFHHAPAQGGEKGLGSADSLALNR